MRTDLGGAVTLLTGASSGLGQQFARTLAGANARLVIAARREEPLSRLAGELGCIYRVADVADEASRVELVASVLRAYGTIDVLVNNAGTYHTGPAEDASTPDFRSVVETNLVGPFAIAREAGRQMLAKQRGSIINIASILGLVGNSDIPDSAYAASKGGLISLTRQLAAEWAQRGVRVNAIAPGYFESEMTSQLFRVESGVKWIRKKTPMRRPGLPGELDTALLFLASDSSAYMTGQVLTVDGGWTIV